MAGMVYAWSALYKGCFSWLMKSSKGFSYGNWGNPCYELNTPAHGVKELFLEKAELVPFCSSKVHNSSVGLPLRFVLRSNEFRVCSELLFDVYPCCV